MTMAWYALAHLPAGRLTVRLSWDAREFAATRARDKRGQWRWAVTRAGTTVWLPMRGWSDEPQAWQPLDAAAFPWPEGAPPEPLTSPAPIMWAERVKAARAAPVAPETPGGAWWLTEPLTYSEVGAITEREAEGRLARALLTDGVKGGSGAPVAFANTAGALRELVADSLTGADAYRPPPFEPSPRDQSDYLVAMRWFTTLAPVAMRGKRREAFELTHLQKLLVWRAQAVPVSWRRIAGFTGRSHEDARQTHERALEALTRVANGRPPFEHVPVHDALAAVRAENRAARARAG